VKSRRLCREAALQALYQFDTLGEYSPDSLAFFIGHFQAQLDLDDSDPDSRFVAGDFCRELVQGVADNLDSIDEQITRASEHWSLPRMARIDRNILRIAAYEMAFRADIPRKASINEAIEIARRFSAPDATMFINGVLDKIAAQLPPREQS